jgi:hypothetical protein
VDVVPVPVCWFSAALTELIVVVTAWSAACPATSGQRNSAVAMIMTSSAQPTAAADDDRCARRERHSSRTPIAAITSPAHCWNTAAFSASTTRRVRVSKTCRKSGW